MADIFLPDLENNPKAGGLYAQSIESLRSAGKEIPGTIGLAELQQRQGIRAARKCERQHGRRQTKRVEIRRRII